MVLKCQKLFSQRYSQIQHIFSWSHFSCSPEHLQKHTYNLYVTINEGEEEKKKKSGPVDMREASGCLCVSHHPRPPLLHLLRHRQRKTFPCSFEQPWMLPLCVGEHHIIALIDADLTAMDGSYISSKWSAVVGKSRLRQTEPNQCVYSCWDVIRWVKK